MRDMRVDPFGGIDHFDITIDGADQIAWMRTVTCGARGT
ncbi:ribose-5-phosphate isomerase A [Streptomyces sp. NBC_01799]|nr:ribose-5-phosphate isomerase A [Streptomyces sp. NBC_01800]WSA74991.1 ribose-5-phosphate isomerase A [Streptomyces sp. NBC_01799]